MPSESEITIYEPLAGPADIRLLVLFPEQDDALIECTLIQPVNLDRLLAPNPLGGSPAASSPYKTLSYVWGDRKSQARIYVNGRSFPVTSNLHSALRRLRAFAKTQLILWVDAICINQSDNGEKQRQVGLMTRIFRQSSCTFADIGEVDKDRQSLLRLIEIINKAGQECDKIVAVRVAAGSDIQAEQARIEQISAPTLILPGDHAPFEPISAEPGDPALFDLLHLEHHGMPPKSNPVWLSFGRFLASPYFIRLWVLQEFVLASKVCALYGHDGFALDDFITSLHYLKLYGTGHVDAYVSQFMYSGELKHRVPDGWKALYGMANEKVASVQNQNDSGPETWLIRKLNLSKNHLVSDPRDRIYALMGLASDASLYTPYIDYTESYQSAYRKYAKLFIRNGHGMELLYQACIWDDWTNLPTWVPNWHSDDRRLSRIVEPWERSDFDASSIVASTVRVCNEDDSIIVRGTIIDSIVALSPSLDRDVVPSYVKTEQNGVFGHALEMRHIVLFFCKGLLFSDNITNYPTHESSEDVFFQTLVRGLAGDNLESERQSLLDGVDAIHCLTKFRTSSIGAEVLAKWEEVELMDFARRFDEATTQLMKLVMERIMRRAFCITARGYFGLVPDKAQVGDRVAIFNGGAVPFLLREAGTHSSNQEAFKLVGDGYFHGLMHGEASALDGYAERDIIII